MTSTTPDVDPTATGTPTVSGPASATELAAVAAALTGERAAVYGYGVVGGQGGPAERAAARRQLTWHSAQRDVLAAWLASAGTTAPPPAPAYALPFAVAGADDARRLGLHIEQGLAAVYADLVAAVPAARRAQPAGWLVRCAAQARGWGAPLEPFPGLPERS
ncbi:MAG TPA: DUF4439 domain-containing protein [Actinomycetales bacterium]|jgi:hypothetical protein